MDKKTILLIAVVALGLFILPQSLSLFMGQHTWYEPSTLDNRCVKCHQLIVDELRGTDNGAHTSFNGRCIGCHTTTPADETGFFFNRPGNQRGANWSKQGFHAATTVTCITCHTGVGVYDPNKYNSTSGTWNLKYGSLLNPNEAHKGFYLASMSTDPEYYDNGTLKPNNGVQGATGTKGANAACLACHTHTAFKSTWRPTAGMDIEITYDIAGEPSIEFNVVGATTTTYTTEG